MNRPLIPGATLALGVLCALLATSLPARATDTADPAPGDQATAFEAAQEFYDRCQWPQAFAAFSRLADAGDAQADRIARDMARFGRVLYGLGFEPTAAQAQRWLQATRSAAAPRR